MAVLRFRDSPTLRAFHKSTATVRIVEGPVESGKSVGVGIGGLYAKLVTMPRCLDGVRRSRFVVWRGTYPQLLESTMKTWVKWLPESIYGPITGSEPYIHRLKFRDVDSEIVFKAFPGHTDKVVADLRSSEYTGAWGNEIQFAPRELFVEVTSRTGRYPSKDDCPDYDRRVFHIADHNAPQVHDHWLLYMKGRTPLPADMPEDDRRALRKPDSWEFFTQPPAVIEVLSPTGRLLGYKVNPKAENLSNMGDGRYLELTDGRTRAEVDRDLRNKVIPMTKGTPRYPNFDRDFHVSKEPLVPNPNLGIRVSLDFGLTPVCIYKQIIDGVWYVYDEDMGENVGADEFAPVVLAKLNERFPFYRIRGLTGFGDPQGGWGSASSARKSNTSFAIFGSHGIAVMPPADKDDPELRLNMGRNVFDGTRNRGPKILIDPRCVKLIAGLDGGCTMKEVRAGVSGTETRMEVVKDKHSHPVEALEYGLWGGGAARDLIRPGGPLARSPKPINTMGRKSIYLSRRR